MAGALCVGILFSKEGGERDGRQHDKDLGTQLENCEFGDMQNATG
jgi:hypothetical protein